MKTASRSAIGVAMVIALAACNAADETPKEAPVAQPFFGQEAPGMTPELFALGVVSTDGLESLPAVSPDLSEFYFIRQGVGATPGYVVMRMVDGEPTFTPVETTDGLGEVFISADGQTMHLGNEYRTRTDDGWSDLANLGPMFEEFAIMRLTSSDADTHVFDVQEEQGTLRYSRIVEGERQEPEPFNTSINSGRWTAHPFIAPDESYLIWDSEREDGFGDTDLYISFRGEDGSWGPAINLGGEINTETGESFGLVTPDGRYFMFVRSQIDMEDFANREANIYWVDAQVIEDLRPAS